MIADKNILGYSNIADEIRYAIMTIEVNSYNFRSFIFGCQKVVDLLNGIDFDLDIDFVRALFLGVIIFAFKHKKNVFCVGRMINRLHQLHWGHISILCIKLRTTMLFFSKKIKNY